jgi:bone morphogenetic protein receptor type-2
LLANERKFKVELECFRYGIVWKGMVNEQPVAVKIFSANKKQYFLNEKDIYTQPFMDSCPALLTYFGEFL